MMFKLLCIFFFMIPPISAQEFNEEVELKYTDDPTQESPLMKFIQEEKLKNLKTGYKIKITNVSRGAKFFNAWLENNGRFFDLKLDGESVNVNNEEKMLNIITLLTCDKANLYTDKEVKDLLSILKKSAEPFPTISATAIRKFFPEAQKYFIERAAVIKKQREEKNQLEKANLEMCVRNLEEAGLKIVVDNPKRALSFKNGPICPENLQHEIQQQLYP